MNKMRKIFTIAIFALSINAFAQIPTNGLIGYYPFSGNANDQSGLNHDGVCGTAALTTDRFGNPNSAYHFSGIQTDTIGVGLSLPYGDFTFAFWFFAEDTTDNTPIDWRDLANQNPLLQFTFYAGGLQARLRDNNQPTTHVNLNTSFSSLGNNWRFATLVLESNLMKYYINGNLQGTVSYNQGSWTLNHLLIGKHHSSSMYNFTGKLDDICIYNRALSQAGVDSIFNANICSQTITVTDTLIINANLTGFNPIAYQNTIKIFPNPSNDHIIIDFGNSYTTMNGYTLKITNSLSQIVYTTSVNTQQTIVDLSTWSGNGIYFVHLIDAQSNTIDIRKIVLQ